MDLPPLFFRYVILHNYFEQRLSEKNAAQAAIHCKPKSTNLAQKFLGEIDSPKTFELNLAKKLWANFAKKIYTFIGLLKFFEKIS